MDRRRALTLLGLGAVAACTTRPDGDRDADRSEADVEEVDVETVRYGDHPAQRGELTRPSGTSRGVVVVIHGGFWMAAYDLSLGRPLVPSLVERGWTVLNLEYRRVGDGGGWPTTFDDVAAGIDGLGDLDDVDTSRVVTLGHSAGGHLAAWAAGREDPRVPVTGVVSQAGVLCLADAARAGLGGGAAQALVGVDPPHERYRRADPYAQLPLDVPVRCVHAPDDPLVPIAQSRDYVEAARAAGADATLVEVTGGHFDVIDPDSDAWRAVLAILEKF